MSGLLNKIKEKTSGNKGQSDNNNQDSGEQQFTIQPHPAKTNNPNDLRRGNDEPPQLGGGLNSNPEWSAFNTPGPYVPNDQIKNDMPPAASHDEMMARSAELNQQ